MTPAVGILKTLHACSLFVSLCLICFSAFDLGVLSIWFNPVFGVATLSFHLSVLLQTSARPVKPVILSNTCNAVAYFLSFVWFAAFFAMIIVYQTQAEGTGCLILCGRTFNLPSNAKNTQKLQFLLIPVQWILLLDLAIRTTLYRCELLDEEAESEAMGAPLLSPSRAYGSSQDIPGIMWYYEPKD